jgi:ligand-binding SRPBCC domain-containing protein
MYKLHFSQKLPIDLLEAWEFFSSPANLEKITPKSLGLKIKPHYSEKKMYAGQIIAYSVKPLWNISMEWITEITAVQKPAYFIDEQKIGPYAFWHHEHWFSSIPNGILMEDILYYNVPFGIFGKALHYLKIKKDIEKIFQHRSEVLEKLFGLYQNQQNEHV